MSEKTVYVLGAGFSMDAGAPSQAALVKAIYDLKTSYAKKSSDIVKNWIDKFDLFLKEALIVDDTNKYWYSLEDIYTPIDRSIGDGIPFKNYTVSDLLELKYTLNRLIILAVREEIQNSRKSKETINIFAEYLISKARMKLDSEKSDLVSVITTNWDIMLDNRVNSLMKKETPIKTATFCGVVDYCCYMSSLDEDDHSIKPGLYAIGKGGYNLKILKLHGSLNWMQCPKCQRLYVKYYTTFNGGYVFDEKFCRHCELNFHQNEDKSNKLDVNLITPTFLKNLNNIQNKLIWQNAGIELSEASKVVFLGYSLPQADFEFKQLLSRMIRKDAEIEAVLIEADNPDNVLDKSKRNYLTAGYRYEVFFSGRKLKIHYDGVSKYIKKHLKAV
ncbi:SIR2 family protein [Mucilaginibacter pedocola]|uniref:Uncharacterized protein n=1 Tax=Mucilaginibacter pedocola TaxID=1792845 RepID=A0A1S9PKP9_9SPHI|nr:hypothetical protein [Mucilaginibacter pedocola]OOQ61128.1 hypothetical protein BC343_22055 [Mucilaginibacter pedocola]